MNIWIRRTAQVGIVAAGLIFAGGAVASASPTLTSHDNYGVLGGNQVVAPVQVPVNVCGVAVAVAGKATAECEGGSSATVKHWSPKLDTSENYGILNGNQALVPVQIPVNVCGIAVAVIGSADANCQGGSTAVIK